MLEQPYLHTGAEVSAALEVDGASGLTAEQVERRHAQHGPNRLREVPARPVLVRLADQFRSALILILIAAAGVALLVGDITDAVVILIVVVLNALLGFHQEHRAEQSLVALRRMLALRARVRRDGHIGEIDAEALVPGDIVLLEAGDKVPADGRLLVAHRAEVDESTLTGESHPVSKWLDALEDPATPLADRRNMVCMNTVVTRGRLEMVVTATGMATEIGRIAGLMQAVPEAETPLQRQLDRLGKRLAAIAGVVVTAIFALAIYQGQPLATALLTAITLAVAAIPEGLPAVVTVTLALGMRRMAGRQAIVKRLAAVETLGCTTVICTDKTGTLTRNRMAVRTLWRDGREWAVDGDGYDGDGAIVAADERLDPLLAVAALCNDSRLRGGELVGDPTEGALAALAIKGGVPPEAAQERCPRIGEIPFDPALRLMATFHHEGDCVRVCVKGAPEVVLARCGLPAAEHAAALSAAEQMAARGLRVLALAEARIAADSLQLDRDLQAQLDGLTLAGLAGIVDPPRPEVAGAVALCRAAGIRVKMITGDHRVTAAAIARELGIDGAVLTGEELDRLDDAGLAGRVDEVAVFARVSPHHKLRIVNALRERRHVVAMTGDGVNDAPALKGADIGVAMGRSGTEVAKEAGDMVLTDDNFATIVRAVREGRTVYENLVKFIRFQLGTNMGALGTVLGASLLGWPVPFNPIQILWVNMIMDGPPAMALGVDPPRPDLMRDSPRGLCTEILTPARLTKLAVFGATMALITLGVFWYALGSGDPARAATLAFTTFVLLQFFNVFNARAEFGSAFGAGFFRNRALWLALVGVLSLQVVVVHWGPAQRIFHTVALSAPDWLLATAAASLVLFLEEGRKLLLRCKTRAGGRP